MINKVSRLLALFVFLIGAMAFVPMKAMAADMPTAAGSPIAGIAFDDRPLMLPDHRNFQMAMIAISSEMGRSCGQMESYGWRLDPEEQNRVNLLFNNTVDRLRAQGYTVEPRQSKAVDADVTLFTADRDDKHLLTLWSAGEIGLVMVMCETSAPLNASHANTMQNALTPTTFGQDPIGAANRVRSGTMAKTPERPVQLTRTGKVIHEEFSPKGSWVGSYTCIQGTTGAELKVDSIKGDQFKGTFSFYPTDKNPFVPKGKYKVFGEYDAESLRILLNPGKWLDRPDGYYNTIMIGSFDPVNLSFSGYFQGITGCTSFEAKYEASRPKAKLVKKKKAKRKAKKKKAKKKKKIVKKKAKKKVVKKAVKKVAPIPALAPAPKPAAVKSSKLPVKKDVPPTDSILLDVPAP